MSSRMGAEENAEVSNSRSRKGFGFSMRGTLDGVKKQIPIPETLTIEGLSAKLLA